MEDQKNPIVSFLGVMLNQSQDEAEAARKDAEAEKDADERARKLSHAAELANKSNIFEAFLSFFAKLLFGEDIDDYVDVEEGASREEVDKRAAADRVGEKDFNQTARENFTPANIEAMQGKLSALRAKHGADVKAISPVENGTVNSERGMRFHPIHKEMRMHQGIDMIGSSDIKSAMPGVVQSVGWKGGYGVTVEVLDIYGVTHRYAHLKKGSLDVKPGDVVEQGQKLADMGMTGGATGVHLHYEQIDKKGQRRDPQFIDASTGLVRTFKKHDHVAGESSHHAEADVHKDHDHEKPKKIATSGNKHFLKLNPEVKKAAIASVSFKVPTADKDNAADKPPAPTGIFAYASAAFTNAAKAVGLV